MFVAQTRRAVKDPTVTLFRQRGDLLSRVQRRLRRLQITRSFARYRTSRPTEYEAFSDDRTPYGTDLLAQLPLGDVINIHSMYQFVDFRTFFTTVPRHTPVVRTLHDMSFFTGGCHSDAGCGKYIDHCGACPQLGSRNANDLSRQIWLRKYSTFRAVGRGRLYLVTPSHWLANEAKRSSLARNFPIAVIPHGVDTEAFCPRDRVFSREVLGIPQDARVVLFVAEPIGRPIKGFDLLAQALNGLGEVDNLLLVSAGSGLPDLEVRLPHLNLGPIYSERLLSLVYSAADLFAIPSRQENFPLTVLEAMACGTPVVGFAVGGIPEIVRPGANGLLVSAQDVTALRTAISELLRDPARRAEMAIRCRRIAIEEYALELQVKRYAELYEAILAGLPWTFEILEPRDLDRKSWRDQVSL